MKVEQVPQDEKNFKDGKNAPKKVIYATLNDGTYSTVHSAGWAAENLALEQAWEDIDQQLSKTKKDVADGKLSPVAYYMIKNRMDIGILSAYMGKWQWQVKRHFKPSVFSSLSSSILQKYASVFGITTEELKNMQ